MKIRSQMTISLFVCFFIVVGTFLLSCTSQTSAAQQGRKELLTDTEWWGTVRHRAIKLEFKASGEAVFSDLSDSTSDQRGNWFISDDGTKLVLVNQDQETIIGIYEVLVLNQNELKVFDFSADRRLLNLSRTPPDGENLARLKRRANESVAMQTLRNLNTAEVTFSLGLGKGHYTDDLRRLGGTGENDVGFLDDSVVEMQRKPKSGYLLGKIKITHPTSKTVATYEVVAFPAIKEGPDRTGDDCFFIDDSGVIRHSGKPDVLADTKSLPIQ